MKIFIYRIFCKDDNIKDCYVGQTKNIETRIIDHKSNCKKKNRKIYNFIRENGNWDNWTYEILEECECEDNTQSHFVEQKYFDLLQPSLNINRPAQTKKEYSKKYYEEYYKEYYKDYNKEYNKKRSERTLLCECGSFYSPKHKNRHLETIKHNELLKK